MNNRQEARRGQKQNRIFLSFITFALLAAVSACKSEQKQELSQINQGSEKETESLDRVEQNNDPFAEWQYQLKNKQQSLKISAYFKSVKYGSAIYFRQGETDIYKLPVSESARPELSFEEAELGGFQSIVIDSCLGALHTANVMAVSIDEKGNASVLHCGALSEGVSKPRFGLHKGQNVLIFEQAVGGLSGAQNATVPLHCTLRQSLHGNGKHQPALYLQMSSQDAEPPRLDWTALPVSSEGNLDSTAISSDGEEEPPRKDSGRLSDGFAESKEAKESTESRESIGSIGSLGLQAAPVELTEYLARLVFNGHGNKVPERLRKLWPRSRPGLLFYEKALYEALTKMSFFEQVKPSLGGWRLN